VSAGKEGAAYMVVDASLWVARLVPQDVNHAPLRDWMERQHAAGTVFVSPALLLAEVAGAVSRRTGDPALAEAAWQSIAALPGVQLVAMEQQLVAQAAQFAAAWGLRGADAVYVATAYILEIPLVTLDADQQARAAHVVRVVGL
jgi:predicted nucleic acid-binding protein